MLIFGSGRNTLKAIDTSMHVMRTIFLEIGSQIDGAPVPVAVKCTSDHDGRSPPFSWEDSFGQSHPKSARVFEFGFTGSAMSCNSQKSRHRDDNRASFVSRTP